MLLLILATICCFWTVWLSSLQNGRNFQKGWRLSFPRWQRPLSQQLYSLPHDNTITIGFPQNTFWHRTILRCFRNKWSGRYINQVPLFQQRYSFPHDKTITWSIGLSRTGIHLGPTIEGTLPMGCPKERHFDLGPWWSCHVSVAHLEMNNRMGF